MELERSAAASVLGGPTPLVGRGKELSTLVRSLEAAALGRGGVVLIGGEPGIGKTRLMAELAAAAVAAGWRVLAGRAYDGEGMPPYLPLVEALHSYLRRMPDAVLRAQLEDGLAEVSLVFPELRRRLLSDPSLPAGAPNRATAAPDRYRLFESLTDFLFAIGVPREPEHRQGLLLLFDDLQWADTPSLLFFQHLARRLAPSRMAADPVPLLVAGAYRSIGLERNHPLTAVLAELHRERLAQRLVLQALDQETVTHFVEELSGKRPAAEVAEAIYQATGGNTFFVEELVRHLLAEGRRIDNSGTARIDWGMPEGVREVLDRRLARLRDDTLQLLQAVAVLGDGFPFDVIADVANIDVERLLLALEEATAAGIVREERETYHFSHALVRQAVLLGLSAPRRQRLHLLAGRALVEGIGRGVRVEAAAAGHFRLAGAAGRGDALSYGKRAAAAASAVYAWEEAATLYRSVLSMLRQTEAEERFETLLALVEAQTRAGDDDQARETWREATRLARTLPDPRALARAALGLGRMLVASASVDGERIALLEEALDFLGSADAGLRVHLIAGLVQALVRSATAERLHALSTEALTLARELGDPALLADALDARHNALRGAEHLYERLEVSSEMARLAVLAKDDERELLARLRKIRDLLEAGDMPGVDADLTILEAKAEALHQPNLIWRALLARAMCALSCGDLAQAERLAREAMDCGSKTEAWSAKLFFYMQTALIAVEQGTSAAVLPQWEAALAPLPRIFVGRCALAWLYTESGMLQQAQVEVDQLAALGFQSLQRDSQNWLASLTLLAQACAALGDRTHAAALYELLLPYAERQPCLATAVAVFGSASRYLGLLATTLGHFPEAAGHFEAALAMNQQLGAPLWLAHTQCDYAAMLLAPVERGGWRSDLAVREHACALLEQSLSAAQQLGLTRLRERAEGLIVRARRGDRIGERTGHVPHAPILSPREHQVLALLAAGATNQEIAEQLTLAVRTVHRHVANIYAKISVRGRVEATAYAIRHGVVPSPEPPRSA